MTPFWPIAPAGLSIGLVAMLADQGLGVGLHQPAGFPAAL